MLRASRSRFVTPAKAGVHLSAALLRIDPRRRRNLVADAGACGMVDPGFRRDDGEGLGAGGLKNA
jgi:hypothetical protein